MDNPLVSLNMRHMRILNDLEFFMSSLEAVSPDVNGESAGFEGGRPVKDSSEKIGTSLAEFEVNSDNNF